MAGRVDLGTRILYVLKSYRMRHEKIGEIFSHAAFNLNVAQATF